MNTCAGLLNSGECMLEHRMDNDYDKSSHSTPVNLLSCGTPGRESSDVGKEDYSGRNDG